MEKDAIGPFLLAGLAGLGGMGLSKLYSMWKNRASNQGNMMQNRLGKYKQTLTRMGVPQHLQPKMQWGDQQQQNRVPYGGVPRRWRAPARNWY
jgi:hypothetical protein